MKFTFKSLLKTARKWFYTTPERALDEAYRSALTIKAIEDDHFQGKKVSAQFSDYGDNVIAYFRQEVKGAIQKIKTRLIEFESSRSVLRLSQGNEPEQYQWDYSSNSKEQADIIIDKLTFIDSIIKKYEKEDYKPQSKALISLSSPPQPFPQETQIQGNESFSQSSSFDNGKEDPLETVSDKTGVVPRSILRTFSRIKQEIDPQSIEAEEEVVEKYRKSRDKTAISIKFLLILVIVPLLVHQFAKIAILESHLIERYIMPPPQQEFFLNPDLEEEALMELKMYKERLELQEYISFGSESAEKVNLQENLKEKAQEIVEEYREKSLDALGNVFSDVFSFATFITILVMSKREIVVLKSFIDEIVYGLSDSAKAFLIILFTDIFVGYHSPHGWEVILEGIAHHLGIPESRQFNFLFIATFPVILDTVLKYWIFRYLNRISPSAVATYRNMNE